MREAVRTGLFTLPFLLLAGCGEQAFAPAPVGPSGRGDEMVEEALGDSSSLGLEDDIVLVPEQPGGEPEAAAAGGEPYVLWLFYADGSTAPSGICPSSVPKFTCKFGGADGIPGCQKQVQAHLDKFYADFNLVFVLTRPTSGKYQTAVITDAGAGWCGKPAGYLGIAPVMCGGIQATAAAYTFGCTEARKCATIIAQEHAHTAGLFHTSSKNDLLTPSWPCTCPGFEDKSNSILLGECGSTQNSYQLMKTRLGAWPGGEKPSPFPSAGGAGGAAGGAGGMGGGAGGGGAGGTGGGTGGTGGGQGGAGGAGGGAGGAGGGGPSGGVGGAGGGGGGGGSRPASVTGGCRVEPSGSRGPASLFLAGLALGLRRNWYRLR